MRRPYGEELANDLIDFLERWPEAVTARGATARYGAAVLRIEELEGMTDEDLEDYEGLLNMGELDDLYEALPRLREKSVRQLSAYADKLKAQAARLPGP